MPSPRATLEAELEVSLVRALLAEHAQLNVSHFRGRLSRPVLELSSASSYLGRYTHATRCISLSRELCLQRSWGVVIEVLKHEMAHQYVFEVLGIEEETAHGPAFQQTCAKLGIDASAAGLPEGSQEAGGETARILDRVAKLLALAESANLHEAQAAMAAAQRLMLKYNLDLQGQRQARGYSFRYVGIPTGRRSAHERILANLLTTYFFVECIWVPVYQPMRGTYGSQLELCGTPSNLEMADYVHGFLLQTGEQLWRKHKKLQGLRSDQDRRTFLAGVMTGFAEQLQVQQKAHRTEGLVWVRDADLQGYYRQRHPRIRHTQQQLLPRNEAHAHGRAAGRNLVLHKPVSSGPSQGPRLLGPKS